jgi:hypothetical protein
MEPPSNYKTAGIMMLVAGILNLLAGLLLTLLVFLYATMTAVGTFGIGILCYACCVIPLIPAGFGIYEMICGLGAMNGKPVSNIQTVSIIGIIMGALNLFTGLGIIPLALEVVATVMLSDDEVKAWLAQADPDLLPAS